MPEHRAFMDLQFEPNWTYISAVRNFVENFIAITFDDKRRANVVAMSVNELVENAIKYADTDGFGIRLELRDEKDIHVEVRNHARPDQAARLRDFLGRLNAQAPDAAYLERMRAAGESRETAGALGLARIRYEARAILGMTERDGNILVSADFPFATEVLNG